MHEVFQCLKQTSILNGYNLHGKIFIFSLIFKSIFSFKKMKQKIFKFENSIIQNKSDQLMVKDVYLQMILFLESTTNILLSFKINF